MSHSNWAGLSTTSTNVPIVTPPPIPNPQIRLEIVIIKAIFLLMIILKLFSWRKDRKTFEPRSPQQKADAFFKKIVKETDVPKYPQALLDFIHLGNIQYWSSFCSSRLQDVLV
jgi:hypothetical protein